MRLFIGIIIALLVNLVLFMLMQHMTTPASIDKKIIEEVQILDFVKLEQEEEKPATKKRELPKKPPPPKRPPPPPETPKPVVNKPPPPLPDIEMPPIEVPLNIAGEPYLGKFTPAPKPPAPPAPKPAPAPEPVPQPAPTPNPEPVVPTGPIVDNEVVPLVRVPPQYPRTAMRRGIEGVVTVTFIITKEGTVRDAKVVNSSPQNVFDDEALKAVRKWKFKPKLMAGVVVERQATQQIEFKLTR